LESPVLDLITDTTTIPPAIATAASFVASATARLETANAALAQAEAEARQVRARIATLEQERAAIIARRASGQHEHEDAARLALLAADSEGLAGIVTETEATVTAKRLAAEAEQALVAQASAQLARAEDEAALTALVEHARRLDTLMADTLQQATSIAQRIGGAIAYVPTPALASSFRRLLAAAGRL
jgi:chromosome segregation ATPase